MRTDSDIKRDVEFELQWEPDIEPRNIAVKVAEGVVTLTGFVPSYSNKYEAERVAKRVRGVRAVANDLEVKLASGAERPDPDIARDAVEKLQHALPYSAHKIKTTVRQAWITLEGDLDWDFERRSAESSVRRVKGVIGVTNLIRIRERANPADVKQKIEDALKRSAELDAARITVVADGGTVRLRGRVRSWAEREQAEKAAWRAPGVFNVKNEIEVDPALQDTRELA